MLTSRQQACLRGIGIRQWTERHSASSISEEAETFEVSADNPQNLPPINEAVAPSVVEAEPAEKPSLNFDQPAPDNWDQLIPAIASCQQCELAERCTQKVPGVGNRQADLMIIGEGPGMEEDRKGEPFVGRSGQLLDKMLAAIGLQREQVYITNIVKCRPPDNRDPKPAEAQACRGYLQSQIDLVAPKVILSVGRISAQNLLGLQQPVGKLIRQQHLLPGTTIPLKVSYHPAYLLRTPSAKAIAWNDLKIVHRLLND